MNKGSSARRPVVTRYGRRATYRQAAGWALHLPILLALLLATPSLWAARETPAPVIEATTTPTTATKTPPLEARLQRLERLLENQTIVSLATRLDDLQREVQLLLGQMEQQNHELQALKKRQRALYLDVDRRIRSIEAAPSTANDPVDNNTDGPPAPTLASPNDIAKPGIVEPESETPAPNADANITTTPDTVAPQVSDPEAERSAYEQAFRLLKEARYDAAISAFQAMVNTYPQGSFADNAQYWLGESNYVQGNFKIALDEFKKVVQGYPDSPKRPDALLKMGYVYQKLGQNDQARTALNRVIATYPTATAARLAATRLQELANTP